MKKAITVLAALALIATSAFAQLTPSISGSAETKWGVNLDEEANGFETSTSVTVTIPLASGEAATEDGEGATGTASITGTTITLDLNATVDGGTTGLDADDAELNSWKGDDGKGLLRGTAALGDITAKIDFANGVYAKIGGAEGIAANKVASDDGDYDVNPTFDGENGMSFGYSKDAVAVELTVVNEAKGFEGEDGEDAVDAVTAVTGTDVVKAVDAVEAKDAVAAKFNKDDAYLLGATASYSAGDIFGLSFALGTSAATKDARTGIAVEATSTPMEGLSIAVPFDYYTAKAGTAMELRPAVDFAAAGATVGVSFHYISVDKALSLDGKAVANSKLNANVGYDLAIDAGTLGVKVDLANVTDEGREVTPTLTWTADAYNATIGLGNVLDFGAITFNAGFTGVEGLDVSLETTINDGDVAFALGKLNLDMTSALTGVENTTFTVNYSGFNSDGGKGTFYVGAKISL